MESILEERFTLHDLLDPATLKEVCHAFTDCFGVGFQIFSEEGEELITTCPDYEFCSCMNNPGSSKKCEDVKMKLRKHPLDNGQVLQIKTFCGTNYSLFPMVHQLDVLGRIILGPYRSPDTPLDTIKSLIEKEEGKQVSMIQIEKIPVLSKTDLKREIKLISKIFESFLFINAKRLITTRLHLDALYSSKEDIFKEVEDQDLGTEQDKEELERLKNMF
jgi:Sensory domain found in PocR